jgi:hypothetical protein
MDLKNIDSVTREALDHYVFPLVSKTDVNAGDPHIHVRQGHADD